MVQQLHSTFAGGAQSAHKSSNETAHIDCGMDPSKELPSSRSSTRAGRFPEGTSGIVPLSWLSRRYKSTSEAALTKDSGRFPINLLPCKYINSRFSAFSKRVEGIVPESPLFRKSKNRSDADPKLGIIPVSVFSPIKMFTA